MRPSGEFGSTLEPASLSGSTQLLTGPEQNLALLNGAPKHGQDQPVLITYDVNLAIGASQTVYCDSGIPDYWMATVRPVTGVKISIFPSSSNSGIPIRLSGGGKLKIPGMSEYFTVLNEATSVAATVTVLAVRGYKHVEIDGGNLA